MLADDFVELLPPRITGTAEPASVTIYFDGLLEASRDLRVEILDVVSDGRRVAVRAEFSGTDAGGLVPGVGHRGGHFAIEGIDVLTADVHGRFTDHIGIIDVRAAMDQLGIVSRELPTSSS